MRVRESKLLKLLFPQQCADRRALRVAVAKSRREVERLRRDVERQPDVMKVLQEQT